MIAVYGKLTVVHVEIATSRLSTVNDILLMSRSFHCINSEINPASGIVTKTSRMPNITSKSYFGKKNEQNYEKGKLSCLKLVTTSCTNE